MKETILTIYTFNGPSFLPKEGLTLNYDRSSGSVEWSQV